MVGVLLTLSLWNSGITSKVKNMVSHNLYVTLRIRHQDIIYICPILPFQRKKSEHSSDLFINN